MRNLRREIEMYYQDKKSGTTIIGIAKRSIQLIAVLFIFSGCDELELQKKFDCEPEPYTIEPFNMTVWEWLQSNPEEEFDFLLEAIERTGLQSLYSDSNPDRTFLFPRDNAFKDGKGNSFIKVVLDNSKRRRI